MGSNCEQVVQRLGVVALAATVSGAPSTLWTIVRGGDLSESTRAAGTILLDDDADPTTLLVAGVVVHAATTALWVAVLAALLPRRHRAWWGAFGGLAIAALDLGVFARRFPHVRDLPTVPQVADHVAFGAVTGWALDRLEVVHCAPDGAGTLRAS